LKLRSKATNEVRNIRHRDREWNQVNSRMEVGPSPLSLPALYFMLKYVYVIQRYDLGYRCARRIVG